MKILLIGKDGQVGLELPHWQAGFGHILQQVLGA